LIDKEMLILRDDRLYHKTPGTPYVSFNNRAGKKMLLACVFIAFLPALHLKTSIFIGDLLLLAMESVR